MRGRWKRLLLGTLLLTAAVALGIWLLLRGSLATLDGKAPLQGLRAPASIQRDALGVVTIDAADEADAMRALGYVHAQERFFEMDLLRRAAAGELSELVGPHALDVDKARRAHRLRARSSAQLAAFAGQHAAALQAYSAGVNQGLHALRIRPWPYLMLFAAPRDWQPVDSALAGQAMYFDLQGKQLERKLALYRLQQRLPAPLYALLRHEGSSWDATLDGSVRGDAALPSADQVDLRRLAGAPAPAATEAVATSAPGSNNWAIAGSRTADGRAIVANDMHLGLRAPSLWFRVRLRYADAQAPGGHVDVSGFSLPGLPAVIVGSNGHVAWGFTNSYADTADWYRLTPCAAVAQPGCTPVTVHRERIKVSGAPDTELQVEDTAYGPILQHEPDGSALALRWAAQLPGALNLGLADFARADALPDAFARAQHIATPAQNLVLADRDGHIGWRVLGPLPLRGPHCAADAVMHDVRATVPAEARCAPWPLSTTQSPQRIDPADGQLWTANARVVGGAELAPLGDGGYALGARAQQIRDDLRLHPHLDERQLLAIQLDDRALFLQRWWALLQQRDAGAATPALHAISQAAKHWEGRASTGSVSYTLVRAWRLAVLTRIRDGLIAPARTGSNADTAPAPPALPQLEGVAWPLLQQQPLHLLPRRYGSWQALLEDAATEVRTHLQADGPLDTRRWGQENRAAICHPLAQGLPAPLRGWLCMPDTPLPGDDDMPRVQRPAFGASERMVVAPGHEADGIVHMPGGQSGHPLSPFWGAGHADWVQGRATKFLPGPTRHTLTLSPSAPQ
ncbi:penicillin acylase family protein [Xanthomonas sontii]|uniref:Penicillin acylase family protein n=2 Tax=Xanthomonas TaxID=338 RepID=A0A6N7QGE0_9XANT|nr:penicillin acylase family protein [Xanthomonas sontii]MRH02227.1 penicillin acylase family protein [Xanthomonas sontii]MRH76559.1 penicillin acylase family protein [Xanthomonas sontii]